MLIIFPLVNWVLTQHRQCVQINGSISRHNSFNGHDEILDHKVFFFNECAGVLEADICQLQGRSCFSCTASQISPTCLHSQSLLNQLSLMAAGGNWRALCAICPVVVEQMVDISVRLWVASGSGNRKWHGRWPDLRQRESAIRHTFPWQRRSLALPGYAW